MYFPEKFYRLPLNFDHKKLLEEISAVDESHWSPHPQAFKGNDALILLSNGGTKNDLNYGSMEFTPCMEQLPYLKQVLQSFNTVIGRTRLMRLAPGEKVGRHSDVSLYWWHRFRIHVPIVTDPEVKFFCEDTHVHMQAGEAWTFDNWRYHEVHNNSAITRVHLVIDTVGSPEIWKMLENESWNPQVGETLTPKNFPSTFIPFDENKQTNFAREQHNIIGVLSPAELDAIADFLINDLDESSLSSEQSQTVKAHLRYLKRAWRAFFSVHGRDEYYYQDYSNILIHVFKALNTITPQPTLKSNGFLLANVLKTQVSLTIQEVITQQLKEGFSKEFKNEALVIPTSSPLKLNTPDVVLPDSVTLDTSHSPTLAEHSDPIFIVSAPCAGGAYLESLFSNSRALSVLGSEKKQSLNKIFTLNYAPEQCDDVFTKALPKDTLKTIFINEQDKPLLKNVCFDNFLGLRIPSLLAEFPNAKFIYVYREPLNNLLQLKADWQNNYFLNEFASSKTGLAWHHPLPNHWQDAKLNKLEDKLAFQYTAINHTIINDLMQVPKASIFCLDFKALNEQHYDTTEALCDFCKIPFGPNMQKIAKQTVNDIDLDTVNHETFSELSPVTECYENIQQWVNSRKS